VIRRYWDALGPYWWVMIVTTLVAIAMSSYVLIREPRIYTAESWVLVSQPPTLQQDYFFAYDNYYNLQASEYMVEDFTQIVMTKEFASDVVRQLQSEGQNSPTVQQVKASLDASSKYRIIKIKSSWSDTTTAQRVANAAADALVMNASKYHGLDESQEPTSIVLDRADRAESNMTTLALMFLVRSLLGLIAGTVLALVLGYLDDTIRSARDVEEGMGLTLIGVLPRHSAVAIATGRTRVNHKPPTNPTELTSGDV
jgi:capsular polysaccharide biosynthesis protein